MNWETRWKPDSWKKVLPIDKAGQEAAAKEIVETASEAALTNICHNKGDKAIHPCLQRMVQRGLENR